MDDLGEVADEDGVTMELRQEPWGEKLLQLTGPNGVVVQLVEWVAPAGT
ncbi:hypothetical protein [Nonomuraea dietziae]